MTTWRTAKRDRADDRDLAMRAAASMPAAPARFTGYVDRNLLPVREIEVRERGDATLALASHAPSYGVTYEPVDDLIISVVQASTHSLVVRDVGLGRQAFTEEAGCILVTPPGRRSYWYFEGTPLVLHLSISGAQVARFLRSMGVAPHDDDSPLSALASGPLYDPLVGQLAARIWASTAIDDAASEAFCRHGVEALLAILYRTAMETREAERAPARCAALPAWRLKQVTALIAERLSDGISVEEMARFVGLSPDHFVRSFAAATGKTPHQWLTEMRIERAKGLLRDPSATTTLIALELGYSSPSHFSSRFRQVVGMSPTTWRQTFLADQARA